MKYIIVLIGLVSLGCGVNKDEIDACTSFCQHNESELKTIWSDSLCVCNNGYEIPTDKIHEN